MDADIDDLFLLPLLSLSSFSLSLMSFFLYSLIHAFPLLNPFSFHSFHSSAFVLSHFLIFFNTLMVRPPLSFHSIFFNSYFSFLARLYFSFLPVPPFSVCVYTCIVIHFPVFHCFLGHPLFLSSHYFPFL